MRHAYVAVCAVKMADQWDSKLDIDKDSDIASELKIYNVELTNKILDTGSFGSFVEAWWYGGPCVAKQVHSKFLESSHSEDYIRSFSRECVTWAKLKHPHIVLLLGLFKTEVSALPLVVIEKMDVSLTTLLEDCRAGDKQLSLQQKVSILLQVSSGLAYLHQRDPPAVHGHLSANNVLISLATLTAKISDFAIARFLQFTSQNVITHTSQLYSPPEVLEPALEESLTAEVDTFSYGVLIVHAINLQLLKLLPSRMKQPSKKGLISLTEFERRRNDLDLFPERERSLFVDLIEKCLEFLPEDRPNSLALVSNLQEIQSKVGQPQPNYVTVVSKVSNKDCSDSHTFQSPTGLGEVQLKRLGKEYQLKKYTEDLQAKEDKLKQMDEDIEEMTKTIQENNQMKAENEKQFKKVLKFNGLKWKLQSHSVEYGSAISWFGNAVKCDGDILIGVASNHSHIIAYLSLTIGKNPPFCSFCEDGYNIPSCAVTDSQTAYHSLQGYALVVCQGLVHMLGGEYVNNYNRPTGKYSRKIITLTEGYNQWNECYPPMKTGSASPAVVNYKDHIVVVHKSGAVEVLNTNSAGSAWMEVHPSPCFPTTPSATLLGDLLVIWSGTLYCTDLQDVFTDDTEDSNPMADWTTLPSPPIKSSSVCLTTLNDQLIAIGLGNTDGSRPLYAFNGVTGKWSHVHNQCPGDTVLSVDSKTLLTFGPARENKTQLCAYIGFSA